MPRRPRRPARACSADPVTTLVVQLPVVVILPRKTKGDRLWYVNLNNYRNAPFHLLSDVKIRFKEAVADQVNKLPTMNQVAISYHLFPGSARLTDVANVCSVADKFFSDALVELGKLPDDNYTFLLGTQYLFGAVDRKNPRVEAHLHIQEPEA